MTKAESVFHVLSCNMWAIVYSKDGHLRMCVESGRPAAYYSLVEANKNITRWTGPHDYELRPKYSIQPVTEQQVKAWRWHDQNVEDL